ncbi:transmembrane protein [Cryptosporidium felis]|nr:transmembrane protein [Cryptosporidium felis]
MERGSKMILKVKAYLFLAVYFASALTAVYGAMGPFPTIDFVDVPLGTYTPRKPSLDSFKTRGELALSDALAASHGLIPGYVVEPGIDSGDGPFTGEVKSVEKIQRASKFEVEMAKILFWRIKTDAELSAFDVSLTILEKLVMDLFRKYGFSAATCQALLVKEGIPSEKATDFCYNLEPFALLECHALTWLDFSLVMDIKFRMKRRGMFMETKDVCRFVERVKPSLIPKPEKKSIFGKCQTIINGELMKNYGITNMDADMICTVMDYTIQPACAELSVEELSEVMKLGLHLGHYVYPRIFPIFISDICTARRMMRRGPSREKCRNSLVRALIERADELSESVVAHQWPLYTEVWRSCAYVYKRKATGGEKARLDRLFPRIAFGTVWSDKGFRGLDRDYPPSPFAHIHGETVEEAPEEYDSEFDLGQHSPESSIDLGPGTKSESSVDLGTDAGSETSVDLSSEASVELDGQSREGMLLSDGSGLDLSSGDVYGSSVRSKFPKSSRAAGKPVVPRERWIPPKTKSLETPDQYLWSERESVALNTVQKAWAQILYSLYSQDGNKAYGIDEFEIVASRIDPANLPKSCFRLIYARIKKYPGTQKDGVGSRFSETKIANWCAAIDGSRSKSCQALSVPALIWSKNILKSLLAMRDESSFAIDLRDVCRFMAKVEPWMYTKKSGFTNHCLSNLSEPLSTLKHSTPISFSDKYRLTEKESKQMCILLKPANHKACVKLSSANLTQAYKLAYELGKISRDDKKLQVTYDAACKVINRIGKDSTSQHCILATAEFVGFIAVESDVAGKEFENGVKRVCETMFEAREPKESKKLVSAIIEDVYSDIAKHMPPQPRDYDIIRRKIVVGDELMEDTRYIRGYGFGPKSAMKGSDARLFSPNIFGQSATSDNEFWTPFGVDPGAVKAGATAIPILGMEDYFEKSEFPSSGFAMDLQWVSIQELGFKRSLADRLKDEFVRSAPASTVIDSSQIPDFVKIVEELDLTPNTIFVSCVKVLKRHRIRSEVADVVCRRIDPYSTPACNGLMIVLLDHAEYVHMYFTSLVKKEAFDLADFCKIMHVLNPLSNKMGNIGHVANECVKAPVMHSFQKKYSLSNKHMTRLCSKLDFTRTQSFARLNPSQRSRVISSSKAISILISDKYKDVYDKYSGVFWARNIPRVSVVNMINLVSHTGEHGPVKEKCEFECQEGSPFSNRVLNDPQICFKACMSVHFVEGEILLDEEKPESEAQAAGLRPRTYQRYERYGSDGKKMMKTVWWMGDN